METVIVIGAELPGMQIERVSIDTHSQECVVGITFFAGGYGEFHFCELSMIFADDRIREIMHCILREIDAEDAHTVRRGRLGWLKREIWAILDLHND
jgi:hypothetical protein